MWKWSSDRSGDQAIHGDGNYDHVLGDYSRLRPNPASVAFSVRQQHKGQNL